MKKLSKTLSNQFVNAMYLNDSEYHYDFDHEKLQQVYICKQLKMSQYSSDQRRMMKEFIKNYRELFKRTRETGQYKSAHAALDQLDNSVRIELPKLLQSGCIAYGQSIRAYNYHKETRYDMALNETYACIKLLDVLVKAGISAEINRIIQQNINLALIFAKMGDHKRAKTISLGIVEYVYGGKTEKLVGESFSSTITDVSAIQCITEQSGLGWISELLSYLYFLEKSNLANAERWFESVFAQYYLTANITTIDRTALHDWITIKRAFFGNNRKKFFKLSIAFFQDYPYRQMKGLKLNLCECAIKIFREETCKEFFEQIEAYLGALTTSAKP